MPGYEDRATILRGAGGTIFTLMCERSTPEQWAEWLRAPLEHAAGTAYLDMVRRLLKAGADGSAGWKGCYGKTLLHAAAEGGDGEIITDLIKAGAEADLETPLAGIRHTPLHRAILGGKEAAVGALIEAGANVNTVDNKKNAALILAIEGGHARIAKDLVIGGANPNKRDSTGDYPLHLAARYGQDEVVLALVHNGADLDTLDSSYITPLEIAVREYHVSTVEVLLAAGADVSFRRGVQRESVLHIAARSNTAVATITGLIEAGADIEARDISGRTPLWFSASGGSCATMITLLQLGADVNAKTNLGSTPLHAACRMGEADAADLLLRWGAIENIVDNDGETPGQLIPDIGQASGQQQHQTLEHLTKLLAHAPQDRAWRRRGFVVMCRAHPDRLRLAVEIPDREADDIGQQLPERSSRRARGGNVEVEVEMGGTHAGGAGREGVGSSNDGSDREGRRVGVGFEDVATWLMTLADEGVFRNIVGFL